MWTRAELKMNARASFKKNYVNAVIISLIFAFISGGLSRSSAGNNGVSSAFSGDFTETFYSFFTLLLGLIIITAVAGIILKVFIFNPLEVGVQKFFIENHYTNPTLGSLLWAFKSNYFNIVKTMFLKDIYLFLWTLLFFIPGIIKKYSYRMVPYILADNPNIDADAAITLSRELMDGEKLDTFVLELSFLPWQILSAITFNIVGILYVFPYVDATNAELYLALQTDSMNSGSDSFNSNPYNNGDYYG